MATVDGPSAFTNPMYHLTAFTIKNPMVQWAIERGAYRPDMCLVCRGTGARISRYGSVIRVEHVWRNGQDVEEQVVCWACKGTGRAHAADAHAADFLDADDEAIARLAFPGIRITPHSRLCATNWGRARCDCALR